MVKSLGLDLHTFLYVDDLADACVFLMEKYDANDVGEFVNIGMGKDLTIEELADLVKRTVGFNGDIVWDKSKPDGAPRKLLDVEKIHSLGWKHKIELEEGLKMYYKWYLNYVEGLQ